MIRRLGALGIDAGEARVGLAKTDSSRLFCFEVASIPRVKFSIPDEISATLSQALEIPKGDLRENFEVIYVGYPLSLSGDETQSTRNAVALADLLEQNTGIPVRLIDERLTTKSASGFMSAVGISQKAQRKNIDAVSAMLILEDAVRLEASGASWAGITVEEAMENG